MEEFLRKYTEEEFSQLIKVAGYPEIARAYLVEEFNTEMDYLIDEEIKDMNDDEGKTHDVLIQDLKEYNHWTNDTVREEAWLRVTSDNKVETYCSQRAEGHSHDWAIKYVDILVNCPTRNIYQKTYFTLASDDVSTDAESEIDIVAKRLAGTRSDIFVEFLSKILTESDDLSLQELVRSFDIYDRLIRENHSEAYSAAYFYFSSEYNASEDECRVYAESFEVAIGFSKPFIDATNIADEFAGYWVNEYFLHVEKNFVERNPDTWERELYYKFLVRQYEKTNEGELNALFENMYLKELGLPLKDTDWMYNDKLFVSAKALLEKSGISEEDSEFCAYQIAFEEKYILPPAHRKDKSLKHQIESLISKYI